jgi:hypothetical protein
MDLLSLKNNNTGRTEQESRVLIFQNRQIGGIAGYTY